MADQKSVEIVPASVDQKRDLIDIYFPEKTKKDDYYKKLTEKQQEYTEKYEPFCYTCAKLDFDDEVRRVTSELSRTSFTKEEIAKGEKKIPLNLKSIDEYSKSSYFSLINSKTTKEQHVVEGSKVSRPAYQEYNYKCKLRKHGITVMVPWNEHIEREKSAGKK